jgi:hypothetical protein
VFRRLARHGLAEDERPEAQGDAILDEALSERGMRSEQIRPTTLGRASGRAEPIPEVEDDVPVAVELEALDLDASAEHPGTVLRDLLEITLVGVTDRRLLHGRMVSPTTSVA